MRPWSFLLGLSVVFSTKLEEHTMFSRILKSLSFAAVVGAAVWTLSPAPASAAVPVAPLSGENLAASQIDTVRYYHRYHRYHRHHRHCWRGRYGRLHCSYR
jgi:hypothetical protein